MRPHNSYAIYKHNLYDLNGYQLHGSTGRAKLANNLYAPVSHTSSIQCFRNRDAYQLLLHKHTSDAQKKRKNFTHALEFLLFIVYIFRISFLFGLFWFFAFVNAAIHIGIMYAQYDGKSAIALHKSNERRKQFK